MLNILKYSSEGFFDRFKDPNSGLSVNKKRIYKIIEIFNIKSERELDKIGSKVSSAIHSELSKIEKECLEFDDSSNEEHIFNINQISKKIISKLGCKKSELELQEILHYRYQVKHPAFEINESDTIEMLTFHTEELLSEMNDKGIGYKIHRSGSNSDQTYSKALDLILDLS